MKTLFLFFTLFAIFTSVAQETATFDVLFDVDQHEVKQSEELKLLAFIENLEAEEILSIKLKGHTDSDAGNDYNLSLSKRRVATVNDLIVDKFQLTPFNEYFGETQPINSNETDKQKEQNRRVEVIITFKHSQTKPSKNISELYKLTSKELEGFCVDPLKDTTLVLKEGTIITIKANTFKNSSSCIEIKAKEIYKYSDMILENLGTASNGSQLETGGMVYLEAKDENGRNLKPQKSVAILMPTINPQEGMELFYGDRHEDGVNWQSTNSEIAVLDRGFWQGCYSDYTIRCPFFFCRIGRLGKGIKGGFNKDQKRKNKEFRESLGTTVVAFSSPRASLRKYGLTCDSLRKLLDIYDVNNYNDLILAMNKELMDSLGLNSVEELNRELEVQRARKTEMEIQSGESNAEQVSYYAFNTSRLGWMNCDRFTRSKPLISMNTGITRTNSIDAKLVFKRFKSVMPSNSYNGEFDFQKIKKNEPVYYIVLKYTDDGIFISLNDTKTDKVAPKVSFEKVSLEELKERLAVLD